MGAYWSKQINLKIVVDKDRNRVLFAEADSDLVDILFSFLTMPLGTILRLLGKQSQSSAIGIGCMSTLYESLDDLSTGHFQSDKVKAMLLRPSNSSEHLCRKLKINIDDTEPTWYTSRYCDKPMYLIEENVEGKHDKKGQTQGGVFVNERARFMITDELKVIPLSTSTSLQLLPILGVRDVRALEERTVRVGSEEVLSLLRLLFLSKTPLTDLFLRKCVTQFDASVTIPTSHYLPRLRKDQLSFCKNTSVKLILRKLDNKVLYAEAQEDFVDFLFSLLAIPMGSVLQLFDRKPSLGCITNLYSSVEELPVGRHIKSAYIKTKLLSPRLAPDLGYNMQLLSIRDKFQPMNRCLFQKFDSTTVTIDMCYSPFCVSPVGAEGFIDGPTTFIIGDDLNVTPLSSISSVSVLNKFNVPVTDIEERVVIFGQEEARRLLEASLISTSALNRTFNSHLKKPKIEK